MGIGAAIALNGDLIREIREEREAVARALTQDRFRPCARLLLSEEELRANQPQLFTSGLRSTEKSPDRVFLLGKKAEGVQPAYNGSNYKDFTVELLQSNDVPALVTRTIENPVVRLVPMHGLGLDISNMGSVLPLARKLRKIANGGEGDAFATWFANQYPHLRIPMEIVVFDLPSSGWAPSLEEFSDGIEVAEYIARNLQDLKKIEMLPTIPVCRSASCALGAIAGDETQGLALTAGTFPTQAIIDLNLKDIAEQAEKGRTIPNQPVIDKVVEFFTKPSFLEALKTELKKPIAVRSIIGSADGETPREAQREWNRIISPRFGILSKIFYPNYRSQHIIKGAGHQVFLRNESLPKDVFKETDPDVIAYRLLLEFTLAQSKEFWNKKAQELR